MKIAIYLISILLVLLIGFQNLGERYGSYVILSWSWLLVTLSPILFRGYQKKEFSNRHLFFLCFLILIVLVQPIIRIHPILILAISLIFIIPFLILEFIESNKYPSYNSIKLNEEIKYECRNFIAENELEKCFEVLLNEAKQGKIQKRIIALKQKWNQNKREKNMSLNTNEWFDVQNSKIVNELLEILK